MTCTMESNTSAVEIFFFPYVGGGHQIPMIDSARVFAAHGAKSTIITTASNALQFQKSIARDQQLQYPVNIHVLSLPESHEIDVDMSATPRTDTSILLEPLKNFLIEKRPDCIVVDGFHRWAATVIDELRITRIVFNGQCCFPTCAIETIKRHAPHEKVNTDAEPFVIPCFPHPIEMTRSQLPHFLRQPHDIPDGLRKAGENSFGTLVNSFYELEPDYADYLRSELGKKAWLIGPVSLCNKNLADKTERGKLSVVDEQSCLNWLKCKEPNSVIYVSFGSAARLLPQQIKEIAHGLEASGCSFIWAVGKISDNSTNDGEAEEGDLFPSGFIQRMEDSNKGFIIRGWAPQLLILEHEAIRGFMTHCGWNSTLEAVTSGVPMITWPQGAEQFFNEKLVINVLKIAIRLGSEECGGPLNDGNKSLVGREKVEEAVKRLMNKTEEVTEMRKRAREIADKARRGMEKGGTSYMDVDALIEEIKVMRLK